MSVVLPFNADVPLRGRTILYIHAGILAGNHHNIYPFLLNHFITLNYCKIDGLISFWEERKLYSFFEKKEFPHDLEDILSYIRTSVRENGYVWLYLNHKELTCSRYSRDYVHDFLIYGFDDEKQCVMATGYVAKSDLNNLVLKLVEIPYEELCSAYQDTGLTEKSRAKNYSLYLRKAPGTKIRRHKIKRDIFRYLHFQKSRLVVWFFNQTAYTAAIKVVQERFSPEYPFFELRFLKTLEDRAELLLFFEMKLQMPVALQKKCADLKKTLQAALIFGSFCNARSDRPAEFYTKALASIVDDIKEAKELEMQIFQDINKYL